MTPELTKPQAALEQLADLNQTLEKEKVQLTPEVEEYMRNHIRVIQDKLQAGQDVRENDLEFIPKVKLWVMMPKEWREKYRNVEDVEDAEEMKNVTFSDLVESKKREILPEQWLDLLHITDTSRKKREWIDETFTFPGGGKIKMENDLNLYASGLTRLPDGLVIDRDLNLRMCLLLTSLPENLEIGGNLTLSSDSYEQVKEDASKLKNKGNIGGDILIYDT